MTTTTSSLLPKPVPARGASCFRRARASSSRPPAEEFAPLAAVFRRRLLVGAGTASVVALGANFAGVTSFFLGFEPDLGRRLRLDALYPICGYSRCLDSTNGFGPNSKFIYPANWAGDQTLLYRTIGREESTRQLDPPSLDDSRRQRRQNFNEPVIAFGPPGSNGELNVSVIVSPVPPTFSIEALGGPKEVGEAVVKTLVARGSKIQARLIESGIRQGNVNYYELEFVVESPSFRRHNVAVCCARQGRLFTLNAQAPEFAWPDVKDDFHKIAGSFSVTF